MGQPVRVLVVDDNPDDRALVGRLLAQTFTDVHLIEIFDAPGLARALESADFQLAITDCQLQWTTGLEVVAALKAQHPETPVVMFTGTGNEEVAVAAMKGGVADYVLKSPRHLLRLATVAKAALERSESTRLAAQLEVRLQALLETLNIGVFRSTREGRLLEGNSAFVRLLGMTSFVEALTRNAREYYARPADRFELMNRLKEQGSVRDYEVELRKADGETLWAALTEVETTGPDGQTVIDGVMEDIGHRKRAARQLEEEHKFVSAILDIADILVLVLDRDGRIVRFNRTAERATDYSFEEVQGRTVWELFVPPEDVEAFGGTFARLYAGQFPLEHTGPWKTRLAGIRQVAWSCTGLLDERGALEYAVCTGTDVTERRRLEDQVRRMQKMDAIGRLAGGVAHDFNNLLTAILGYSALLLDELKEDIALRHDVLEIRRAAERAADLTRQLLAFSRQQVLQPRLLDLNAVLLQLDRTLQRAVGEKITVERVADPDLMTIWADPGQIEQVVMNLVVNAVEAMAPGGCLTLATSNVVLERTATRDGSSIPAGPYVVLRVTDTGMGIDDKTQLQLFEPFFTTKELGRGIGLGLASAHGIVSQSGGFIEVESEVGAGTTFRVYLPASGEAPAAVEADRPGAGETLLIVDDEEPIRTLMRSVLQRRGYVVLEAADGLEALSVASRHDGVIHLVISDVVMPRMNGPEAADRLKHLRPGLKVLYVSGYADSGLVRNAILRPGIAFLQKPFTPAGLVAKIRQVLDTPEPTAAA